MKIAVWMDRGKMVRAAMGEIPCDLTVCNIQPVSYTHLTLPTIA